MKVDSKMDQSKFDVIVIGAGSGGLNIATFTNRIGLSTLLIDKSDANIGGDCLNFGCVPSKALIHIAKEVRAGRKLEQFGITTTGEVDMRAVMSYVKGRQDIIREHESADWFRKKGMTVALGLATFVGPHAVKVGETIYSGRKIILATGSRPRTITLPGMERVPVFNNESIFNIDFLPKNLVIIGGGPIGVEIGQAFGSLGSQVTILEKSEKFLPKEDREIAEVLYRRLVSYGVEICFNVEAEEIGSDGLLRVRVGAEEQSIKIDALFVSIGRELNIDSLALDKAGIEQDTSGHKLKVDPYLRTTNKDVLVCGDVVGQYQFTHVAELHASVIIKNLFSPFKTKLTNDHLAWVTFTDPEIATFGLQEGELKERGIKYEVLRQGFGDDDRAITDDYREGLLKLFVNKKGKILGGSMVANNAGELIQELILAQTKGLTLAGLFTKIYPYPTATRVNKRIAGNYLGRKLTTGVIKFLRLLYSIVN